MEDTSLGKNQSRLPKCPTAPVGLTVLWHHKSVVRAKHSTNVEVEFHCIPTSMDYCLDKYNASPWLPEVNSKVLLPARNAWITGRIRPCHYWSTDWSLVFSNSIHHFYCKQPVVPLGSRYWRATSCQSQPAAILYQEELLSSFHPLLKRCHG